MAKLYFRYGSMNSGKTTLLLQTAHNYEESGMKVVIVKPGVDTKGNKNIISRIGIERKVDLILGEADNLFDIIKKKYKNISCVLVDESQFLTASQVNEAMDIVLELDIPVICYGLRTDFLTNGFPGSTRLLQIAHSIEEMKTICQCGKKAIYNARFIDGVFTNKGSQIAIDGESKITYTAMCGKCYRKRQKEIDK